MKAGRPVDILMRSMKMEVSLHSRIQSGIFEYLTNPTFSRHSRNKNLTRRVCHIHVLHYAWRLSSVFSLTPSGGLLPLRPPVRLLVGTERASERAGLGETPSERRMRDSATAAAVAAAAAPHALPRPPAARWRLGRRRRVAREPLLSLQSPRGPLPASYEHGGRESGPS